MSEHAESRSTVMIATVGVDAAPGNDITATLEYATHYPQPGDNASPYDTIATPQYRDGTTGLVPGYEVLRELGRGGMGVVYLARQLRPSRLVALKMVLSGAHAGAEDLMRFRREIEALASVSHANLVPIYEVGEHDGRPWYAMQYVAGGTLAAWIGAKPQPPKAAAALVEALARAVHSVHQRGIVHRDLKPANILLEGGGPGTTAADREARGTGNGRTTAVAMSSAADSRPLAPVPKIADFGLAKRLDDDTSPTLSGSVMGTPSYMAPEQAEGNSRGVGPCTDVYALGAILYNLLTGRPPFQAETAWETIAQVKTDEPIAPRRLQPRLPVDLETICLKCLRKQPAQRYGSADELAGDLARFLAGEPVLARPIGTCERAIKWARRRPALAALLAVCCFTAVALGAGLVIHAGQLHRALAQSEAHAEESRHRLVRLHVAQGARLMDAGDELAALPWLAEALHLSADRPDEEEAHRIRLAVTLQQCPRLVQFWHHANRARLAIFDADGSRVLTVAVDGTARIWDAATGASAGPELAHGEAWICAAFRPDGTTLMTADADGSIWTRDARTGQAIAQAWKHGPKGQVAAFNREGTRILVAATDGTARVWDIATQRPISPPLRHGDMVHGGAFSADGLQVATAGADNTARRWSVATGQPIGTPVRHRADIHGVAFSADGQQFVTAGDDNTAHVWDAKTSALLTPPLRHNGSVHGVAFHPRSRQVLTVARDHTVRLWDISPRRLPAVSQGPVPAPLKSRAPTRWLSGDGRLAVAGEGECRVRLRDGHSGAALGPPLRHGSAVQCAAFSPDDLRIVTGSDDNAARIWNGATGQLLAPLLEHASTVFSVEFSPDGRWLVTASADRTARAWDAHTGEPLTPPLFHSAGIHSASFGPAGRCLRVTGADGSIHRYDLSPDPRPTGDLVEVAQLLAGRQVDPSRGLLPIRPGDLQASWEQLRTRSPADFAPAK